MSPEDKQKRLKELSNSRESLSDQEIKEKERLEEELELIHREETEQFKQTNISLGNGKEFIIPIKRQKKSLLEIIINKIKKKPVTFEQIERLKNERTVAYLKRDIAKANYDRKNPGGKQKQPKPNTKNKEIEESFKSSPKDFRNMSGSNDKNKYKGLIG